MPLFFTDSFVQFWKIDAGKVTFSNKFLKSAYYNESHSRIPPYRTFGGTTPGMGPIDVIETLPRLVQDACV